MGVERRAESGPTQHRPRRPSQTVCYRCVQEHLATWLAQIRDGHEDDRRIQLQRPGRWLDPGPLGCLGVGAPFAIAAKLHAPERPVLVIQGDGSFGLSGFDFETAVRFELPMVIVVGNDAAWGQILIPQRMLHGEDRSPATRLLPTRYDRVVEALGGHGEHVDDPADLAPALDRAFASGKVYCIDVAIDPEAAAASGAAGYAV